MPVHERVKPDAIFRCREQLRVQIRPVVGEASQARVSVHFTERLAVRTEQSAETSSNTLGTLYSALRTLLLRFGPYYGVHPRKYWILRVADLQSECDWKHPSLFTVYKGKTSTSRTSPNTIEQLWHVHNKIGVAKQPQLFRHRLNKQIPLLDGNRFSYCSFTKTSVVEAHTFVLSGEIWPVHSEKSRGICRDRVATPDD